MLSHANSESAWVHIAACTHLRVQGISNGDFVDVAFAYEDTEVGAPLRRMLYADGYYELPSGLKKLKVSHICESGEPVTVDLINGR